MKSLLGRVWAWVKWPLFVLLVLFIAANIYLIYKGGQIVKTREAVAKIHATRLSPNDVFGPVVAEPDPVENNRTLAGVDANHNGIRDDVELAIYKAHKDSAKITAADLQYALELQMDFTSVFNQGTLVAVLIEQSRGYQCVPDDKEAQWVKSLVLNTQARKDGLEKILEKYMTSYTLAPSDFCDIDPTTITNNGIAK